MDEFSQTTGRVALFPLANAILLPGAVMPLHVFEDRYRKMAADVLSADGLTNNAIPADQCIGIAVLEDGHDEEYLQSPPIGSFICVGKIISHEVLADGRYNLLLLGLFRAKILREIKDFNPALPYRIAEYERLIEPSVMEIDLANERQRLMSLFAEPIFAKLPVGKKLRELVRSSRPTAEVADVVAYHLVLNQALRRRLLEDADPKRRVPRIIAAVADVVPRLKFPPAEA